MTLELIDAIKARFPGSWTSIAYGSTEIGRGATLLDPDLYDHPGSVGQPPPMVTATLSDDGELWLRGPTMFSGYLDRPDATAEAIDDDGWFHTGDLATRDADGYFTITGRRSESIRSGGEWVRAGRGGERDPHPPGGRRRSRWSACPTTAGASSCARPSSSVGGATLPTVEELRAHLGGALIGAKQPRVVVQVDALPRTDATGQIRRRRLRDQIVAERSRRRSEAHDRFGANPHRSAECGFHRFRVG